MTTQAAKFTRINSITLKLGSFTITTVEYGTSRKFLIKGGKTHHVYPTLASAREFVCLMAAA